MSDGLLRCSILKLEQGDPRRSPPFPSHIPIVIWSISILMVEHLLYTSKHIFIQCRVSLRYLQGVVSGTKTQVFVEWCDLLPSLSKLNILAWITDAELDQSGVYYPSILWQIYLESNKSGQISGRNLTGIDQGVKVCLLILIDRSDFNIVVLEHQQGLSG